jgi:hypothetical protein
MPSHLRGTRRTGEGPWAPEVLAEDARRLAEFQRTREAVPWEDVKAWLDSWGTPHERPTPVARNG